MFPRRMPQRTLSSTQVVVLSFLGAIAVGTLLLSLPVAHSSGQPFGLLDALFTATSAICVTGLIVVDTGTTFSVFGQTVLILLMQTGGLGYITFGALVAIAAGQRVGFRERQQLQTQLGARDVGGIVRLIRWIVVVVVAVELVGALLLWPPFAARHGLAVGFWYALFHSVSAFNNAGFSLYADSLSGYVGNPLVNLTVTALFVLGGLGFIVAANVFTKLRRRRTKLSLHTKMVLSATLFLLGVGALVVLLFEWTNPATLGALPWHGKLLAALFQGATPRTAGFNTLDYGAFYPTTLLFTMLLMYIGGNPGSTAGGVKTVTMFVLVGSSWSFLRGHGELTLFGRRIVVQTVVKATVMTFTATMLVGLAFLGLVGLEPSLPLLPLAFETVSAFSTVGLSTGITAELSAGSKLIIILLMYLGRVGLLTFALALVEKRSPAGIRYPAEDIVVG